MESEIILAIAMVAAYVLGLLSDRIRNAKLMRKERVEAQEPSARQREIDKEMESILSYNEEIATKGGNE